METGQWRWARLGVLALTGLILAVVIGPASAQQVTGTLGEPSATTTITGKQLPAPDQKFCGKIEHNALQSTPCWPARIVPPAKAPNILLIMTDRRRRRTTPSAISPR
jgi:hypothetical protein